MKYKLEIQSDSLEYLQELVKNHILEDIGTWCSYVKIINTDNNKEEDIIE